MTESGIFYDTRSADRAIDELRSIGYDGKDISIVADSAERAHAIAQDHGNKAAEGAATGGALGVGIGAIIAALTATGSVAATVATGGAAAPFIAGPLVAALAGAGAGGFAGGLLGLLIGSGIPENRAKEYEAGMRRGGFVLAVHPRSGDEIAVRDILRSGEAIEPSRL